ncbi:MAG: hypothetical protein DRI61_05665, partial [Chloroflexi bacterium]
DEIDEAISQILDRERPELDLIEMYWDITNGAKDKVGTAAGYTGFSELLFFRYIMLYLERELNCKFEMYNVTPDTFAFKAGNITLTHDIGLAKFLDVKDHKTDIAVIRTTPEGHELLAAFEMKVYFTSNAVLLSDVQKLRDLVKNTNANVYQIYFLKPTKQGMEDLRTFSNEFPARAYAIGIDDIGCNISLKDAVKKISGSL